MKPTNRVDRTVVVLSSFLALSVFVSGCGLTKSYVQIQYQPATSAPIVKGANTTKVKVAVVDNRIIKDHIGTKGSEYSFLGPIIATNDVAGVIAKAIETELVHRGFVLGDGPVQVIAELSRFYAEYQTSLMSEKIVGELVMQVQVTKANSGILYGKMITGQGAEDGNVIRGGEDTELALEKALHAAISQLFNDPSFIEAILNADKAATEINLSSQTSNANP